MAFGAFKKRYVYVDDSGKNWIIKIAEDRVNNVAPGTGLTVYNAATPPSGGVQGVLSPKRCRGVHAQGTVAEGSEASHTIKRFFICNIGSPLYASNQSQTLTYTGDDEADSIMLTTTGRKGEHLSF
jgi:hypothetical protein